MKTFCDFDIQTFVNCWWSLFHLKCLLLEEETHSSIEFVCAFKIKPPKHKTKGCNRWTMEKWFHLKNLKQKRSKNTDISRKEPKMPNKNFQGSVLKQKKKTTYSFSPRPSPLPKQITIKTFPAAGLLAFLHRGTAPPCVAHAETSPLWTLSLTLETQSGDRGIGSSFDRDVFVFFNTYRGRTNTKVSSKCFLF